MSDDSVRLSDLWRQKMDHITRQLGSPIGELIVRARAEEVPGNNAREAFNSVQEALDAGSRGGLTRKQIAFRAGITVQNLRDCKRRKAKRHDGAVIAAVDILLREQ